MNAEFLEKYIVISSETTGEGQQAVTTYSTPNLRKNLAPISFIGAVVVTDDGLEAYPVELAMRTIGEHMDIIGLAAGPYAMTYTVANGKLTVVKGS